ncbi:MAG: hypothetical protein J6B06_01565 [Lachnospiraceae bacterium]|nr:hypothetical protein [Lachnospiraceae bacterium]
MNLKAEKHYLRKRILENGYLKYIDCVNESERNKEIIIQYVNGASYKELSEKYGVTKNRIPQIVNRFAMKACWYEEGWK